MTQDEGGISKDENGIYYGVIPQPPNDPRLSLKLDTSLNLYSRLDGQNEFKIVPGIKFPPGLTELQKKHYLYQLLLFIDSKRQEDAPKDESKQQPKQSVHSQPAQQQRLPVRQNNVSAFQNNED